LLDWFHDYICGVLVFILVLIGYVLLYLLANKRLIKGIVEASSLEFVWTVFPIIVLIFIGFPSMFILYSHEVERVRDLTIKVTGHQWYWSYDYSNLPSVEFDSFIVPLEELTPGQFRLLEVDNRTVVPVHSYIRFAVSSGDVLHSWSIPPFGLKVDATPSRLNFVFSQTNQTGLFYGQCSEICGANHSFMPICLEVVSPTMFGSWVSLF
jgi:cytochrome c oxidase subunit 2